MLARQPDEIPSADVVALLGVRFHNLSRSEAARAIAGLACAADKAYIVKPYSEFMPRAARDPQIRDILNHAALCLADGIGILWAAHYLSMAGGRLGAAWQLPLSLATMMIRPAAIRYPLPEAMAGVDLTWLMLQRLDAIEARIFLLGGTEEEVQGMRREIQKRFYNLRVAGARHGYFAPNSEAEDGAIADINSASTDVLLVAMGFPRQELWIAANLPRLNIKIAVAEGGSFSFISGTTRRAPRWMRGAGMEWLFRLLRQPSRIRRQLALPLFVWLVFRQRLRGTRR